VNQNRPKSIKAEDQDDGTVKEHRPMHSVIVLVLTINELPRKP
jgi:hypothetical protein